MKHSLKAALAALALVSVSGAAKADLTLHGAVGLPLNPTASVPADNQVIVQGDYFKQGDGDTDYVNSRLWGLHAATGIGGRWEINGGWEKFETRTPNSFPVHDADKSSFALGAKYLVRPAKEAGDIAVAVGGGYSDPFAKNLYAYVVGSKKLASSTQPTVHFGVRFDRYDINRADTFDATDGKSNQFSAFAGVEFPISKDSPLSLVGEIGTKTSDFGDHELFGDINGESKFPYSAALRYRDKSGKYFATAGIQRSGYPGLTNSSEFFAQVGMSFGR